jgi:hypothetical protein
MTPQPVQSKKKEIVHRKNGRNALIMEDVVERPKMVTVRTS